MIALLRKIHRGPSVYCDDAEERMIDQKISKLPLVMDLEAALGDHLTYKRHFHDLQCFCRLSISGSMTVAINFRSTIPLQSSREISIRMLPFGTVLSRHIWRNQMILNTLDTSYIANRIHRIPN